MKKFSWKIFAFVGALALTALACATPSMDSILNPLPKDDFSSSSSGWGTGTDSQSSVEYVNGGLQMIVYQPFFVTWSTPSIKSYENVHIEASVKNASPDSKAFFGIICNEQGKTQSFYYVGVSPDGYYAFLKSAVAQKDVSLKEGKSDAIAATAQSMRIGLDCGGGSLTLYVNGQKIDSATDTTYPSGGVGLFAATDSQNSGANVTFDDFAMTKLGQ